MTEPETTEARQTVQRVRVGMTGLAFIIVLIALGSAIFTTATDEPPVTAAGAADQQTVSNLTAPGNMSETAADAPDEPLAELGVAPSMSTAEPANAAKIASQISAEEQKDSSKAH